ncbi:MAG TPA: hypothetical protein VND95_07665 [Stellaceae bacterium]|nr:hypothetical protein [Stellaceae bacterium]
MLLFLMGLPGGFAPWCETLTAELARSAGGPAELIRADTLAEVAASAIATGASCAVVAARHPSGRLRAALVEHRRNFIVALDDPRLALLDLVLGQAVGLADAVQALASSCAALMDCPAAPGALVLHGEHDWPRPAATAAAIANHCQIAVDDAALAGAVAAAAAAAPARLPHDSGAWWDGLTAAEQETVTGAIGPYVELDENGELPAITWTGALFFRGDRPNERAAGPIDITGRARCLIDGPHIMLPPGLWSLSLAARVSREAAEHEFFVEVCTDERLAAGTIRPQREGSAGVALDFALDGASDHPIAIRISSTRAAFDGAIALAGATFRRAAAPA